MVDFPLQASPWQYLNKGTYGHPGGILHSSLHGIATFNVLYWCLPYIPLNIAAAFGLFDFILHYHIDFGKVRIGRHFNLKPDNSEWFWILLGFDQLLHGLTYIFIIASVL